MIRTDTGKTAADLGSGIRRVFELAAEKVLLLDEAWNPAEGTPVFTVEGTYTTRGGTEWTQGFQFGMPILISTGPLMKNSSNSDAAGRRNGWRRICPTQGCMTTASTISVPTGTSCGS